MFLLMSGTNYFAKKYFLTPFWDSTKFSLFCKVRACRFSITNSIFQKLPQNVDEMFLLMSGTNYFAKKYFLTPFWDSTKFSLFCKVRACRFSVKNPIFQKLPQMLTKCFFWWVVSTTFETLFGKLNFWQKIDWCGPYKIVKILYYLKMG